MIRMKLILLIVCGMMSMGFAHEKNCIHEQGLPLQAIQISNLQKVYVDLDQLSINEEGIFLALSDTILPVSALYRDQNGFYVLGTQLEQGYSLSECPNGHPSRHGDGRCNQPSCPHFRGR